MAFEQRPNSGALFKNDKAGDNPKAPGYRGDANINGQAWEIAAWVKEGKRGKFFSLAFKPKQSENRQVHKASDDEREPF